MPEKKKVGRKKSAVEKVKKHLSLRKDIAEFIENEPSFLDNLVNESTFVEKIFEHFMRKTPHEMLECYKQIMFRQTA